jgi:hypothetical protein
MNPREFDANTILQGFLTALADSGLWERVFTEISDDPRVEAVLAYLNNLPPETQERITDGLCR